MKENRNKGNEKSKIKERTILSKHSDLKNTSEDNLEKERLIQSYNRIQPDEETYGRILKNIKAQADFHSSESVKYTIPSERAAVHNVHSTERISRDTLEMNANGASAIDVKKDTEIPPKTKFIPGKYVLPAAACIAIFIAIGTVGYAAYQKWKLPKPTSYDGSNGIYQIETEALYSSSELGQNDASHSSDNDSTLTSDSDASSASNSYANGSQESAQVQNQKELTDQYFVQQAASVLEVAGLTDVDSTTMRVVRQENLYYGRKEAEVFFENNSIKTSVKFNAQTGKFLGLTSIDWQEEDDTVCTSQEEADALARFYYEKLPVEQGYEMTECEKYDEQYWSYEFCRKVKEGLYNPYEMVRISINPESGRITGCNVFYMPLLDDHEAGDQPLTQEEAVVIAQSIEELDFSNYQLENAQADIVLPNWWFTEYSDADLQVSEVSRLAWTLTYNNPNSEFADTVKIYVDYYTGEVLGGDSLR